MITISITALIGWLVTFYCNVVVFSRSNGSPVWAKIVVSLCLIYQTVILTLPLLEAGGVV